VLGDPRGRREWSTLRQRCHRPGPLRSCRIHCGGWRGIIISNDGTPIVDGRLALGPCRRTRRRRALMKALPWILERKRFITKSHEQHCPSFTQSPSPPRSLVRDGQTSPHSPRLVVSRSTCPPLSTLLSHTIPFPAFTSVWWSD
jgi:hypothetical protein